MRTLISFMKTMIGRPPVLRKEAGTRTRDKVDVVGPVETGLGTGWFARAISATIAGMAAYSDTPARRLIVTHRQSSGEFIPDVTEERP